MGSSQFFSQQERENRGLRLSRSRISVLLKYLEIMHFGVFVGTVPKNPIIFFALLESQNKVLSNLTGHSDLRFPPTNGRIRLFASLGLSEHSQFETALKMDFEIAV
jgi:hypothetical protein